MRSGQLEQLSTDHSLVQNLIDRGDLAEQDRHRHPQSHVITRAVGVSPEIELEKTFSIILPGDKFLICSDGLSNCLPDDALADELISPLDSSQQADHLLERALGTAATDNLSFVLLHT